MKYRIKPYDEVNDIWILERRVYWIFWTFVGASTKEVIQKTADELNAETQR